LALFTFAIGVHGAFPYERLGDRLMAALSGEYIVRADSVSRGWLPGRFSLHGVRMSTRTAEPVTLRFDRVDLAVDLGALLDDRIDLELETSGPSGRVEGRIHESGADAVLDLEVSEAPLAFLSIGAPMKGDAALSVRLTLPRGSLAAARGQLAVRCEECTTVRPRIWLGRASGQLTVKNGVACITAFEAESTDGQLTVEGGLRLGADLGAIDAELLARFRLSDAFRAASPGNRDLEAQIAGPARLADGRIAYAAKGRLGALTWTASPGAPARVDCAAIGIASPAGPVGVAAAPGMLGQPGPRPSPGTAPTPPVAEAGSPAAEAGTMQTLGLPRSLPFPDRAAAPPARAAPPTVEPEVPIAPESVPDRVPEDPPPSVPLEF
jgi:type II secretion system protein N